MDEFLTDEERVEQLKSWWKQNGWFLIGGVALGFLVLFGWRQYQSYEDRQAELAAALYQDLKAAVDGEKADDAAAMLARMRAEYPGSAYTQQGGLLIAKSLVVGVPERAAEELRFVMEHSDDAELALIARLRLARILAYREQYQEALALLAVQSPGQFAGRINEVKGDIQAALGHVDEARAAYLAALVADGSELVDRSYLQMKLTDLPGAPSETPAPSAVEPVPAATPEAGAPAAGSPEAAASPSVEQPAAPAAPGNASGEGA